MNVLIAEYFTGGGLCGNGAFAGLSDELRREGELMTRALTRDLGAVPGVRPSLTRDRRLGMSLGTSLGASFDEAQVHLIGGNEDWTPRLRELLEAADAFWPIAPETGGVLAGLCELCEQSGRLLLNSSSAAVRRASSKRLTADALRKAGVPCVETWCAGDRRFERMNGGEKVVVKPDDGVGCENARLVTAALARETVRDGEVIQPYLEGRAASMNVLYGGDAHRVAGLNLQEVERIGGGFSLKACTVNGLRGQPYHFDAMAGRLRQAIPGLAGHVGVDFVVHGREVRVLEVNPRLTTSYAGLHRSLGVNPAACVLALLSRSPPPQLDLAAAATVRVAP